MAAVWEGGCLCSEGAALDRVSGEPVWPPQHAAHMVCSLRPVWHVALAALRLDSPGLFKKQKQSKLSIMSCHCAFVKK